VAACLRPRRRAAVGCGDPQMLGSAPGPGRYPRLPDRCYDAFCTVKKIQPPAATGASCARLPWMDTLSEVVW